MASTYRNYEREAHELVQVVLSNSLEQLQREQAEARGTTGESCEWPAGTSIAPEAGLKAIQDYVRVRAHTHSTLLHVDD